MQRAVPRVPPRLLATALNGIAAPRVVDWSFNHYLKMAHPAFAALGPVAASEQQEQALAA
jgi:hypothetical protein